MNLYIAQCWNGDIFVTDDRDCLPPDITDFHEVFLPEKIGHDDKTYLYVDVGDSSSNVLLDRKAVT